MGIQVKKRISLECDDTWAAKPSYCLPALRQIPIITSIESQ